jgi:hypothetical protein
MRYKFIPKSQLQEEDDNVAKCTHMMQRRNGRQASKQASQPALEPSVSRRVQHAERSGCGWVVPDGTRDLSKPVEKCQEGRPQGLLGGEGCAHKSKMEASNGKKKKPLTSLCRALFLLSRDVLIPQNISVACSAS